MHLLPSTVATILCSLSANQEVAVLAVDGLGLVSEAQARHKTAPTATAALGRALLGSLLMGCFRKDNESLQITFAADGPLKGVQVIAESTGLVKGKVGNSLCDLPVRADGKLDVGRAVGKGTSLPSLLCSLDCIGAGTERPTARTVVPYCALSDRVPPHHPPTHHPALRRMCPYPHLP